MATKMKCVFSVEVEGAGTSSATTTVEAEAYDKIEVSVPGTAGAGSLEVQVQPGGAGQVRLLLVTAASYENLTYTVTGGSADVPLDAPQLLVGSGAIGLLLAPPNTITFANANVDPVEVEILVGRAATS